MRANSYSRGPLAPSVTRWRIHFWVERLAATSATVTERGDAEVGRCCVLGRPRVPCRDGTCQAGSVSQTSELDDTSKQYHRPSSSTSLRRSWLSPYAASPVTQ